MNNPLERNSLFYMANLGSEVTKIYSAKKSGDTIKFDRAIQKAQEIISELKKLPDAKDNLEVDILKDIIENWNKKDESFDIKPEHLQSYFYPFAMRFMQNVGQ